VAVGIFTYPGADREAVSLAKLYRQLCCNIICHKTAIISRHETEIILLNLGDRDMADAAVDFAILAGAGAPIRSFKAGEVIFRQGDPADELYIVKSGKVEIRLGNRLLDTLPELSIFGEMALIDHSPRSATAVAATDATVVPVSEKQFLFLVSRTPHFALNVMRVLAQRLRTTNSVIY
jgi:CRP/FNR family transcriptional regulator, cyclic AMP receptor protein